jgi:hypothetical protein
MVQANYQFITDALGKLGFEDFFNNALKAEMLLNKATIPLTSQITLDKETNKILRFELDIVQGKDTEKGFYFFNGYKATLQKDGEKDITQYFKQHYMNGIHIDKAPNLLEGRSAHLTFRKNGEDVGRWVKINFAKETLKGFGWITHYDKDIKFNLAEKVSELGVIAGNQAQKEKLLESLANGERVSVVIKQDNKNEKRYIEANPQIGKISVFDLEGNNVSLTNKNRLQAVPEGNSKPLSQQTAAMMQKGELGKGEGEGMGKGRSKKTA